MRNQEGKIELQKKLHRKICVRDITFLAPRSSFYVISSTLILRRKKNFLQKMVRNGGRALASLPPPSVYGLDNTSSFWPENLFIATSIETYCRSSGWRMKCMVSVVLFIQIFLLSKIKYFHLLFLDTATVIHNSSE